MNNISFLIQISVSDTIFACSLCVSQMKDMTCRELVKEVAKM